MIMCFFMFYIIVFVDGLICTGSFVTFIVGSVVIMSVLQSSYWKVVFCYFSYVDG